METSKQKIQQPDAQEEIAQKGQRSFSIIPFNSRNCQKPTSSQPLLTNSSSYSPESRIRKSRSKKKTAGESLLHSPRERTRALSYSENITSHRHPHSQSLGIKVGIFDRLKGLIKL